MVEKQKKDWAGPAARIVRILRLSTQDSRCDSLFRRLTQGLPLLMFSCMEGKGDVSGPNTRRKRLCVKLLRKPKRQGFCSGVCNNISVAGTILRDAIKEAPPPQTRTDASDLGRTWCLVVPILNTIHSNLHAMDDARRFRQSPRRLALRTTETTHFNNCCRIMISRMFPIRPFSWLPNKQQST